MAKVIGIDPDLIKSGVALLDGLTVVELRSLNLPDLLRYVVPLALSGATVKMEDPRVMKPTFARAKVSAAGMRRIAQNVGQVKAAAELIELSLRDAGVRVILCRPLVGYAKLTKRNAELFNKITGWNGKSNEDTRDAAMIAMSGVPK